MKQQTLTGFEKYGKTTRLKPGGTDRKLQARSAFACDRCFGGKDRGSIETNLDGGGGDLSARG
jgi:hypothetical protein